MSKINILFCLQYLFFGQLFSQSRTISVYYNESDKNIKEIYQTLVGDTTIKHGDYRMFSKEGTVLERGQYINGVKTGKWTVKNPSGNVITYGIYNKDGDLTGAVILYDNSGNFSKTEYYRSGLTVQNDPGFQKEMIDSLFKITAKHNQGNGFLNGKKAAQLDSSVAIFNKLPDNAEKFDKGSRLIYELLNYNELVYTSIETEKEINRISQKIKELYKGKYYQVYQQNLRMAEKGIEDYSLNDTLSRKIEIAQNTIKLFQASENEIDTILIVFERIDRKLPPLCNNYKADYPLIYSRQVSKLEKNVENSGSNNSPGFVIKSCKLLTSRIDSLSSWYNRFKMTDSILLAEVPVLKNNINRNFPELTKDCIITLEKDISEYMKSDSAEQKLYQENKILKTLDYIELSCNDLTGFALQIDSLFPVIRDNYLKSYPGIFKNEIKPVESEIMNNRSDSIIERKIEIGKQIISKLRLFDEQYKIILQTDKAIDAKFPVVKTNYFNRFRDIYNKEIVDFEIQKNEYEKTGNVSIRIATGKNILDKINEFDKIFNNLVTQESEIDSLFPSLKQKYKEAYSVIYKRKIKEIENQIDDYKLMKSASQKMKKGEEILTGINTLTEGYDALKIQENEILQKLQNAETDYKDSFTVVHKTEIKDIRDKYKEYSKIENIESKINVGTIIIGRLDNVLGSFPELKELDAQVNTLYPEIQNQYKKNYSPVYKAEIVPLKVLVNEYKENGFVASKINSGKQIMEKLKYYSGKLTFLTEQNRKLKEKLIEYDELYKSRKDVKNIYKKGKMAYNEYYSKYEDESNIEKKCLVGEDIELILMKLISISNKDNTVLNNEIKSAETAADVKRKLGL
jgi:hypothetical protein